MAYNCQEIKIIPNLMPFENQYFDTAFLRQVLSSHFHPLL
jgi:hypothetical protein